VNARHRVVKLLAPKLFRISTKVWDVLSVTPRPMILFIKEHVGIREIVGLEIGVARGENAHSILRLLPMKRLYLVDFYMDYVENGQQLSYAELKDEALRSFNGFSQVVFIQKPSAEAVGDIQEKLDFVYIDGNHDYDYVKSDLENYFSMVKEGGVIGGHDYTPLNKDDVVRAVNEFVAEHNLRLSFYAVFPDWWIVKPTAEEYG